MSIARPLAAVAAVAAIFVLPGCRALSSSTCNKPQAYQDARDEAALRIPLGLDAPDTRSALHIPALDEPAAPRGPSDPCLDEPPAYVLPAAS